MTTERERLHPGTSPVYIDALDTRLRWLDWARTGAMSRTWLADPVLRGAPHSTYHAALELGELFVMIPEFCRLVEHARRDIPIETRYDARWLQAPMGFCYLAEAFETPLLAGSRVPDIHIPEAGRIRAVAWYPVPEGQPLQFQDGTRLLAGPGVTGFLCFAEHGRYFTPFSYFALQDGHQLGERILAYERAVDRVAATHTDAEGRIHQLTGAYVETPEESWKHEMRWTFTALHLMAQRLATRARAPVDRAARRRIERAGHVAPPFLRVITLRRLEAARARAGEAGHAVDWQWQWTVRGHWRQQFHPSTGTHVPTFIDAYVKGPADKPLKTDTLKLFVARR